LIGYAVPPPGILAGALPSIGVHGQRPHGL
jgi:hypothetical protein